MKFRFLLWMLGRLMAKASRTNAEFQQQLEGKELVFQLHTLDGKVARHYRIKDKRVTSHAGVAREPAFAIGFKDALYGFATMNAKNKQLAFMQGIQNKDIQIQGNPALVIWFQGLLKHVVPKKKKKTEVKNAAGAAFPRWSAARRLVRLGLCLGTFVMRLSHLLLAALLAWDWARSPRIDLRWEPPLIAAGSGKATVGGHCSMPR